MQTQLHDINQLSKILEIHRIRKEHHRDISKLLDYLIDSSPVVANEAKKSLAALVPMASLAERWPDDTPVRKGENPNIPQWLPALCKGWGKENDFIDRCIQKAIELSPENQEHLLSQLAAFLGMERQFERRLERRRFFALKKIFARKVRRLRNAQFPPQLSVSLTLACQLTCAYCISTGVGTKDKNEVSLQQALRIFDWASKAGIKRIGLTGGEPTLYSNFDAVLKTIKQKGFQFYLATNGLCSSETIKKIADNQPLCVTMHLTPQVLNSELCRIYKKNASYLTGRDIYVAMRCNFSKPADNVLPYFDVAIETGIKEIRAAIPIPNAGRHNQYVDADALADFGNLLDNFVATGKSKSVETILAKPFFPCKLKAETAKTFFLNGSMSTNCPVHLQNFSNNITVYPDGRFIPCLGVSLISQSEILQNRDTEDAAALFADKLKRLIKTPLLEQCEECPLWIGGRCVGACLSYRLSTDPNKYNISVE